MERVMKNIGMACLVLVAVFALAFMGMLMMHNSDPAAIAAQQGDRIWTLMNPGYNSSSLSGNFGSDGSGASTFAVPFPADSNAQAVVYYVDATGGAAGDDVEYWGYVAGNTLYTTLSEPYCGGTTSYAHVASATMVNYGGGVSLVAIDDGAGNVGYAELKDGKGPYYDGATTLRLTTSGNSNFAQGPIAPTMRDLSGVTFAAGSKVYPLFKIGRTVIGAASSAKDNDQGIVAASKGSPLVVAIQSGTGVQLGSGVTLHAVTVKYQ